MTKSTQPTFFPAGEDLPLFTGQPVAIQAQGFKPPTSNAWQQLDMQERTFTTSRPHNFYPERDCTNELRGKPVRLPAHTPVHLVKRAQSQPAYIMTDCLVEADRLFSWVHHAELGIE